MEAAHKNILIVGCGSIGSWHIVGLQASRFPLNVYAMDKDELALRRLSTFLEQNLLADNRISISPAVFDPANLNVLPKINLVIIATPAVEREKLINCVLQNIDCDFWVLEKPLAQSVKNIRMIRSALFGKKVFVNFPRRMMTGHQQLFLQMPRKTTVSVTCEAPGLSIASNVGHFIDLVNWWTDSFPVRVDCDALDNNWVKSKRAGFWEVSGILKIIFGDGSVLKLSSVTKNSELSLSIKTRCGRHIRVMERRGVIEFSGRKQSAKFESQSLLTGIIVDQLMLTGNCRLVKLEDAAECSELLTDALLEHWNSNMSSNITLIPIT